MEQRSIILLDSYSLLFRAHHAMSYGSTREFANSKGTPTGAIYGFMRMLLKVREGLGDAVLVAVFDAGIPQIRMDKMPEYKANRDETPNEIKIQSKILKDLLKACGIPVISVDGFEADDVIGTYATLGSKAGIKVNVVTGDRDLFQLSDDNVTVHFTKKGISDMPAMTPAKIEEEYGVTPSQYPLLAAMRGDPSDNIPGVPMIGPKIATGYIQKWGDLEGIRSHLDEIGGKRGDSMREHFSAIEDGLIVTTIIRDVPVPVEVEELSFLESDKEELVDILTELEFNTLAKDITESFTEGSTTDFSNKDIAEKVDVRIGSSGDLSAYIADIPKDKSLSLFFRKKGELPDISADIISFSTSEGQAFAMRISDLSDKDKASLEELLLGNLQLVVWDYKNTIHALSSLGLNLNIEEIPLPVVDVHLAAHLLDPASASRTMTIQHLLAKKLRLDIEEFPEASQVEDGQFDLSEISDDDCTLVGLYVNGISRLSEFFIEQVKENNQLSLLQDLEIPTARTLAAMEDVGIAIDRDVLIELGEQLEGDIRDAKETALDLAGDKTINLNSPKELSALIFDKFELPPTTKTKYGYSTSEKALASMQELHPFIPALFAYRGVAKLQSTYVDPLQLAIKSDGRIHTEFDQANTATGRLASKNPNLQNIPIRTDIGRRIRRAFVAGVYEHILVADYSQLELRIIAHLSGDEGLINAFSEGLDIHAATASQVFEIGLDEVTNAQRSKIKGMVYGLAYGLSAWGLSKQLSIDPKEAKKLQDSYFEKFPKVKTFLESCVQTARETGYTETMMGRRRYLPELKSSNRMARENAERMALNAPIQGSAADLMKLAMISVYEEMAQRDLEALVLLQVHDELVLEVSDSDLEETRSLVQKSMEEAMDLSVPLTVDTAYGASWAQAEKH